MSKNIQLKKVVKNQSVMIMGAKNIIFVFKFNSAAFDEIFCSDILIKTAHKIPRLHQVQIRS